MLETRDKGSGIRDHSIPYSRSLVPGPRSLFFIFLFSFFSFHLISQDFGFGFDDEADFADSGGSSFAFSAGGEVSASLIGYVDDFSKGAEHTALGDIFSGKLNFSASTPYAEGVIKLNLIPAEMPVSLDEAYMRVFLGRFDITAGLRKLTWGKADSFGPLDVINPLDYSQIFIEMSDNISLINIKTARPLIHAAFRLGDFSKIEGVFIPWFEPHFIPRSGKWAVAQVEMLAMENLSMVHPQFGLITIPITVHEPETTTFNYAQAGLRFTTTIGSADLGAQYYYGRLPQPSAEINVNVISMIPFDAESEITVVYNPYHQIGFDYAQVLFGFNTRAEFAVNITEDLNGDDGSVYNPFISWSLGFDRDIAWGINLNIQVNESIRLMHSKLGDEIDADNPMSLMNGNFDIEGGRPGTATRLTAAVSRKFFREELELRAAVVWGMEDRDCAIMPAFIWSKDNFRASFSGGFFAGNTNGQLGQYRDNDFLKIALIYTF
ncbi:MAG: hypothetical protein FWG89_07775 [Treponema sp.]|nr:hypothetical protein [Treponema sp.]